MSERKKYRALVRPLATKVLRRFAHPICVCDIRLFKVIHDFNREALGIEADFSSPAERVIRYWMQIISWRSRSWCCSSQDVIALHQHSEIVGT